MKISEEHFKKSAKRLKSKLLTVGTELSYNQCLQMLSQSLYSKPYEEIKATLTPVKGVDVGAGAGEPINTTIFGGQVGIILDGRGRPLHIDSESSKRISDLKNWSEAFNEYPDLGK